MMTTPAQPETVALFVSDVHLSPSSPRTAQAFFDFLRERASQAQALFVLGDLFEAWPGDDALSDPWNQSVARAIRAVSDAGVKVFWLGGNRDFLVGLRFAEAAGASILDDLHVTTLAGRRIALAHGDAQCTNDKSYMSFRAKTRKPLLQKLFLALPLAWRQSIVDAVRGKSRASKREKSGMMMDVSPAAVEAVFEQTGAAVFIHGHTHRPTRHDYAGGTRMRFVLPDWECEGKPERGGWVALFSDGSLRRFDIKGRMVTHYPGTEMAYP